MASLGDLGAGTAVASPRRPIHLRSDISCSGLSFQCTLSSLQSSRQSKVLFPGTCSSSEMHLQGPSVGMRKCISRVHEEHQQGPPVLLRKCINTGHKERSEWFCQQSKRNEIEQRWREFFKDPSEWRDHRLAKANPRFPDFKHQKTEQALWVKFKWTPLWVEAKLAAMTPGTIKASSFSWNLRLSRHAKAGQYKKTLELYEQMQREGVYPERFTFSPVLSACASLGLLEEGRCIHKHIRQNGFESDVFVGSSLIDMYTKCGRIKDAEGVFKRMPTRDVVTWTAMIMGYVKCGEGQQALELYRQMHHEQVDPDPFTFVAVLNACVSVVALKEGRRVHEDIIERGYEADEYVASSLVNMYTKCGSLEDAGIVFTQMHKRDVVTWNNMILGYVKYGKAQQALDLYQQMQQEQVDPDPVTFLGVLNACAILTAVEKGKTLHKEIIQRGYDADVFVGSSLVDMYGKCGSIEDAVRVFNHLPTRNVVTWSAMILAYVKCGEGQLALELYQQMQQEGVDPDPVTFLAVLNACASVGALEEGRAVHKEVIERGYETDEFLRSSLVDMYGKCESIEDAERVFNSMPTRSGVTWSAMILGYVKCGQGQQALKLYQHMQQEQVDPNPITFVAVLNACACVGALKEGRAVHEEIIQRGYENDVFVGSSLVDMYGKCGSIDDAEIVFKQMPKRNLVVWNAMLAAYGRHGYAKEALEHFKKMCDIVEVNGLTFVCLLTACSHGGLVDVGLEYFKLMSRDYNISPTVEHYACMVDLLGRGSRLGEAEDLIMSMPMAPNTRVWMSLLSACRAHVNVELAERCVKQLLELEPENAAGYILLSDIYVAAGKSECRARIHHKRLDMGLGSKKTTGRTWIEVDSKVHMFEKDDNEHPQTMDVHAELERLSGQMNAGIAWDRRFVLGCVDDENHTCHHSEMLAIAFGLIHTSPGTPLRSVKNMRMCGNCHMATKFIAKIVGHAIILKDANCIHHFQNGLCSCRDYW